MLFIGTYVIRIPLLPCLCLYKLGNLQGHVCTKRRNELLCSVNDPHGTFYLSAVATKGQETLSKTRFSLNNIISQRLKDTFERNRKKRYPRLFVNTLLFENSKFVGVKKGLMEKAYL